MPYVPSKKIDAKDREIIDPAVEGLAKKIALKIVFNQDLKKQYKKAFVGVAKLVDEYLEGRGTGRTPEAILASSIVKAAQPYGYYGAHLGEFNYAITRLIQRVPQIKVANGAWEEKNELRYWIYIETVGALRYAENRANELGCTSGEVFEDVTDEYKWKVNRAYEMAQIVKSGDCYDTPFYMRLVEVVNEDGSHIGYIDIGLARSDDTVGKDVLEGQFVLRRRD